MVETLEEDELKEAGPSGVDNDVDENDIIPPPDPSFTRSPALLHQISLLREHPEADYHVRNTGIAM